MYVTSGGCILRFFSLVVNGERTPPSMHFIKCFRIITVVHIRGVLG